VGLRPLVAAPSGGQGATKKLSREHTIVADANGLVTVTGGKWTTYRAMAEDVLDACFRAGMLPEREGGVSRNHLLVGADGPSQHTALYQAPGQHLFGSERAQVQACPGASRELGMGMTEAMVRFSARSEYAVTVEDVLARRWRALFLDARQALAMAPQVAAILREETGLDPQLDAFQALALRYLPVRGS